MTAIKLNVPSNGVYVLVWRSCDKNHIICTGPIGMVQSQKQKLKSEPQYRGGNLIIRTKDGLEAVPNWTPKQK